MRSTVQLLVSLWVLGVVLSPSAEAAERRRGEPYGTVSKVAAVPAPGFPEGIAVRGNKAYVAGPAALGTAGSGPSKVFVYNLCTGDLMREIEIQGQDLTQEHAVSELALDMHGRLYVIETQQGVLRMNANGRRQEVYGTAFPNLPTCSSAAPGEACSPTFIDLPPLPNGLAFDSEGNLYVTDSFQATIWRIPAGGGAPQVWFQDARLDVGMTQYGPELGPNGVRVSPDGRSLYFSYTGTAMGTIYRLPLKKKLKAADLEVVQVLPFTAPDGIAFGEDGKLYVSLALSNQVAVLSAEGEELARLPEEGAVESEVPLDSPAILAFDGKGGLLLTNHAIYSGNAEHFAVLRIQVDDAGQSLPEPWVP